MNIIFKNIFKVGQLISAALFYHGENLPKAEIHLIYYPLSPQLRVFLMMSAQTLISKGRK